MIFPTMGVMTFCGGCIASTPKGYDAPIALAARPPRSVAAHPASPLFPALRPALPGLDWGGWRARRQFHECNLLRRQRSAPAVGPVGQRQSYRGLASCGLATDGVPKRELLPRCSAPTRRHRRGGGVVCRRQQQVASNSLIQEVRTGSVGWSVESLEECGHSAVSILSKAPSIFHQKLEKHRAKSCSPPQLINQSFRWPFQSPSVFNVEGQC